MGYCSSWLGERVNGTCVCKNCAIDPPSCVERVCHNGGRSHGSTYTIVRPCTCTKGYGGKCCEKRLCLHGGIKTSDGTCSCRQHYGGRWCETLETCEHGGTLNGNYCSCKPNFEGKFCEKMRCINGGWYDGKRRTYSCICKHDEYDGTQYHGTYCEKITCKHGELQIDYSARKSHCDCNILFSGPVCSQLSANGGLLLIGLPLLIVFLIGVIIYCKRKARRRAEGEREFRAKGTTVAREEVIYTADTPLNQSINVGARERNQPPVNPNFARAEPERFPQSSDRGYQLQSTVREASAPFDDNPPPYETIVGVGEDPGKMRKV